MPGVRGGDLPRLLVPAFQLGFQFADFEKDEWAWLRRATVWSAGIRANAVAAQFSICCFATRQGLASSGRNVLAVLDEVTFENLNAAIIQVEYGIVRTGTLIADPTSNTHTRDDRGPAGNTASYFALAQGNNAANPTVADFARIAIPALSSVQIRGPWMLSNATYPSGFRSAFIAVALQVNSDLVMSCKWRERELLDTEL